MRWIGIAVAAVALGMAVGSAQAAIPQGTTHFRTQACLQAGGDGFDAPRKCRKVVSKIIQDLSLETIAFTVTARGRCEVDAEWGWVARDVSVSLRTPKGMDSWARTAEICDTLNESRNRFSETVGGTFDFYYPSTKAERRKKRLGWRLASNGRTYAAGRIVVTSKILRPTRTTTIWQGTDAFINVCINRLERLWSRGGRLYCESTTPGVARVTVRLR